LILKKGSPNDEEEGGGKESYVHYGLFVHSETKTTKERKKSENMLLPSHSSSKYFEISPSFSNDLHHRIICFLFFGPGMKTVQPIENERKGN
jgi:hypothetical protein